MEAKEATAKSYRVEGQQAAPPTLLRGCCGLRGGEQKAMAMKYAAIGLTGILFAAVAFATILPGALGV